MSIAALGGIGSRGSGGGRPSGSAGRRDPGQARATARRWERALETARAALEPTPADDPAPLTDWDPTMAGRPLSPVRPPLALAAGRYAQATT